MENFLVEPGTDITKTESDNLTESLPGLLLKPLQQAPEFLPQPESLAHERLLSKKMTVKSKVLKRVTPFLLFVFILPVIFIYLISAGKEADVLFQLGLLLLLEINIIFFDFALCNYFEGKKLAHIWLLEMLLIFLIVFLIL